MASALDKLCELRTLSEVEAHALCWKGFRELWAAARPTFSGVSVSSSGVAQSYRVACWLCALPLVR